MKTLFAAILSVFMLPGLANADNLNKAWEKGYTGSGMAVVLGAAADSQNNIIVTGGDMFTRGAHTIKYDPSGTPVWGKDLVQSSWDGAKVAIDSLDNIVVAGNYASGGFLIQALPDGTTTWSDNYPAHNIYSNASVAIDKNDDYIVLDSSTNENWMARKYDKDGVPLWEHEYAGATRYPRAAQTDSGDNIIFAGDTYSPASGGANTDFCIIKCDPDGDVLWGPIYYDSGDYDYIKSVSLDKDDNIYASGTRRISGKDYLYIRKYDKDGAFIADVTETGFEAGVYASAIQENDRLLVGGDVKLPASAYYTAAYDLSLSTKIFDVVYNASAGTDQVYAMAVDTAADVVIAGGSDWEYLTVKYETGLSFIPSQITDLAVSSYTGTSVELTWTAPGDDETIGTASQYDLRYSAAPLGEGNWASAAGASGEPVPLLSGTPQVITITGLESSTTYYFGIKSADEAPHVSALSNVASCRTAAPPAVPEVRIKEVVYPNPYIKGKSAGGGKITIGNLPANCVLRIYTVSGGLIKTIKHDAPSPGGSEEWNVSDIPGGMYLYTVIAPGNSRKGKIGVIK